MRISVSERLNGFKVSSGAEPSLTGFTGKEQDEETGFYYYGARYLNPKTSMWISADPAMGEYIPSAPTHDEARKRNGNLPGMGGVFNYVNMHVYHYAGNNPVRLVDPDGRTDLGAIFRPLEITIKIIKFFAENKEALQRIGIGSAKILMGLAITALGTGGGAGITIGSGGTAALGGVALADAAIVAGGVCVGAGVADIIDGIVMMSQGNDGGGQTNRDTTNSISQSAKDAKPLNNSQAEQFAKDRGYKNVHQFKDTVLKDEGLGIKNSKRYDITVNNNTNESFLRAKPGNPDIPQAIPLQ